MTSNCGCKTYHDRFGECHIQYCPVHAAAPAMYEALKGMMEIAEIAMPDTFFRTDSRVNKTREALAKAEGKQ